MKKIKNKNGLSLTELLVASIMIGIVMVGVASFNYTVGSIESKTDRSTIIKSQTAAAMLQIKKDIQLATGDITNPGIRTYEPDANHRAICVRHDVNDPASYADDRWICYDHGSSWGVNRCINANIPPGNPANVCNGATDTPFRYELTKNVDIFYDVNVTTDAEGLDHINFVEITLSTAADTSVKPVVCDPIKNPCYALTTRISPVAHSR